MSKASEASSATVAKAGRNVYNFMSGSTVTRKKTAAVPPPPSSSSAAVPPPPSSSSAAVEVTERLTSLKVRLELLRDDVLRSMVPVMGIRSTNFAKKSEELTQLEEAVTDIDEQIADLQRSENRSMELINADTLVKTLLSKFDRLPALPSSPSSPSSSSPLNSNVFPTSSSSSSSSSYHPSNFNTASNVNRSRNANAVESAEAAVTTPINAPSSSSSPSFIDIKSGNKYGTMSRDDFVELDSSEIILKPNESIMQRNDGKFFVVNTGNSSSISSPRQIMNKYDPSKFDSESQRSEVILKPYEGIICRKPSYQRKFYIVDNRPVEQDTGIIDKKTGKETIKYAKHAQLVRIFLKPEFEKFNFDTGRFDYEDPEISYNEPKKHDMAILNYHADDNDFLRELKKSIFTFVSVPENDLCGQTQKKFTERCRAMFDSTIKNSIPDENERYVFTCTYMYTALITAINAAAVILHTSGMVNDACKSSNPHEALTKLMLDFTLGVDPNGPMGVFLLTTAVGITKYNSIIPAWRYPHVVAMISKEQYSQLREALTVFHANYLEARTIWLSYSTTKGGRRRRLRSRRQKKNHRNTRRRR